MVAEFDVCGELPTGTTVLEASAGTGKTFTIAALAARYVAEGLADLPRLMLVTFGRAATAELRERVRERLVSAERGLADPARARASDDTVLARLADVDAAEAARRRRRLAAALADFDAATIATTHQFCQQMRAGLGLAADSDPDEGCLTRGLELVAQVVRIARELSDTDRQQPRLYVITRNAQAVTPDDRVNLDQGGVRGLMRVIGAEQAPLRATQIDVDPRTAADQLAQELLSGSDEDETAWREGLWYTARLRRAPLQAEERRTTLADPESDGMRLQIRTPGDLQTLELVAAERPAPAAGHVEVAVSASSINFADVLAAFGRYPTFDGKQPQLGLDFAGVVTTVGPGVTEYRVGDKVGGFGAGGCWGTYVTCDARLVAPLPVGLTAEAAAAASTGYVTAWYGLCDLARIGPDVRLTATVKGA